MPIGRRVVKILLWGFVLLCSTLGGGLWFAYWYVTNGESTAKLIREQALRFFPSANLDPGRVHISLVGGKVELHDIRLRQEIDGATFETVRIPWLSLRINRSKLTEGQLGANEIIVNYPTLRLCRRRDGRWNLQGLLADPWPGPWIETPPILIRNATLELITDDEKQTAPTPGLLVPLFSSSLDLTAPSRLDKSPADVAPSPARSLPGSTLALDKRIVNPGPAILRDVTLKIEKVGPSPGQYKFEGSARGDVFDKLALNGTFNFCTGITSLAGKLDGLSISDSLRRRIPVEARPITQALALNHGVVDIQLNHFRYDPTRLAGSQLKYQASIRLREGVWEWPLLPFTVNDLDAWLIIEDGVLTVKHAQGSNGMTTLRAEGVINMAEAERGEPPLDLHIGLIDLELDQRLRNITPSEYKDLWNVFNPAGRVNTSFHLARSTPAAPLSWNATVDCRDVSAVYREFRYPLEHLTGLLSLKQKTLDVDLKTLIGGRPVALSGRIDNPGANAVVQLDVHAESLPVDGVVKKALHPDVRKVIDQFNPSGLVRVHAQVFREPGKHPEVGREGLVEINVDIDLSERCEITWEGLPYPIRNLKGRLHVEPNKWTFQNMSGSNGLATILASGSVETLGRSKLLGGDAPLKIDIKLHAQNLPFSGELERALPKAWRKTWPTINPSGACDVDAEVHVTPGRADHTHIEIVPRRESNLRLEIVRSPQPGVDPGGIIELPMENVRGRFIFNDGDVAMRDVNFTFRGGPVKFSRGTVRLEDTGRFDLNVHELLIERIRFDLDLRKRMPPLMAQFALRLDDGHSFRVRGDLQIGWSGVQGDLAWCKWSETLVVFNDNTVKTAIPLEHIQGQIEQVRGSSNGRELEVEGILKLGSVSLLGQQITHLESPFHVNNGVARLDSIRGSFLNGDLLGENSWITLDDTPRYHTSLSIQGAQLEEYARTISGRQSYRGMITASIELNGLGSDVRSLHGGGEAQLTQGDLGELPALFRIAKFLNPLPNIKLSPGERLRTSGKTAFDSADISFTVSHGLTTFDSIKFTGNAFSLLGQGTLDPQGNLDLRLNVLWGRDRFHFPVLSDFTREASTPFLICHVQGTPSFPRYEFVPLPLFNDVIKLLGQSRVNRQSP
jgi:hypothetical protein